ncbi:MAG: tRNA (N6-threonylcarbamoyladenosine(37)-N6)-methyltransferase TrmO [Prevotella sp.]|nr:tRNA (N6-threonylcarbamoyladenosine(37)-N6)-methyltransferase TrmO [Prevotella sp.]
MNIEPIAYFRSPFTSKFGIPRQSGIVSELRGRVEFVAPYLNAEALRGLEEYDYVWLIWGFSENVGAEKHATVRPPLLGGNRRVGVWATRSSFRPNNLALSSVRLVGIDTETPAVEVAGADLMDGTPIYDVKPYLPYTDSHPQARGGFTDSHPWPVLKVVIPADVAVSLDAADLSVLEQLLAQDPRPHYHRDACREYGMPFKNWDVRFKVADGVLSVLRLARL